MDTVIKVENLSKKYKLGTISTGMFFRDFQSWLSRKSGKKDPNIKIGQETYQSKTDFWALSGIDFEVKKGEALGIIGANGAGKSTLLKVISQITAPTDGKVYLKGRVSSMLEVGTGFHPEMTGRENIYMNGAILGMPRVEIDKKIEEIIEFSECREFIDTPVKRYSSGMYVKLAFSVASHLDSDIMVIDEVLSVGDVRFQEKCLNHMSKIMAEDERTILSVSHNLGTIRQLCTRCIVLNKGKIIFDGDVEKAIPIYLDRLNQSDSGNKFFITNPNNFRINTHEKIPMFKSLEFLKTQNRTYKYGDKIPIWLEWDFDGIFEDHCVVQVVLRNTADWYIIGMAQSASLQFTKDVLSKGIGFLLDISSMAPGEYFFRLDLVSLNQMELGYTIPLLEVYEKFHFSIVEDFNQNKNISWKPNTWGNISFPEMDIIQK